MADRVEAGAARVIVLETSFAALPETAAVRRLPRAPRRDRPVSFRERFEDRALWYDAFWDAEEQNILLVGPPPLNLMAGLHAASYTAQPSGAPLRAAFFPSRSTMVTRLEGAPAGTEAVTVTVLGHTIVLPVQPNLSDALAGANILLAVNKDNRLDWIAHWADWHVRLHGVDTVVLVDNGSQDYTREALAARLAAVPGLARVVLLSMPHRFGATDPGVVFYPYWAHFLQISCFDLVLRRLAARAAGLLNLDIDELCHRTGGTIFAAPELRRIGAARIRGRWIEAEPERDRAPVDHRAFPFVHANPLRRIAAPKWVLDPGAAWVADLAVHPYWHRIFGAPAAAKTFVSDAEMFHFRAINTGWKDDRADEEKDRNTLVRDERLALALAAFHSSPSGQVPDA